MAIVIRQGLRNRHDQNEDGGFESNHLFGVKKDLLSKLGLTDLEIFDQFLDRGILSTKGASGIFGNFYFVEG